MGQDNRQMSFWSSTMVVFQVVCLFFTEHVTFNILLMCLKLGNTKTLQCEIFHIAFT